MKDLLFLCGANSEHRKPNPDPRGQAGDRGRSPKGRRGP